MISVRPVSTSLQRRQCSSLVSFLCFVADRTLGSKIFLPSLRRISHLCLLPGGFAVPPLEWVHNLPQPVDADCGHTWSVCGCDPDSGFGCAYVTGLLCFCYSQ